MTEIKSSAARVIYSLYHDLQSFSVDNDCGFINLERTGSTLRSHINLFLVIALGLALSCVTAPGIRTTDVAELHYGDREEKVVQKLGHGSEILYFVLGSKQYRYRLYTTIYIEDVYALLFLNGELIAIHNEKQDFSECLRIDVHSAWEHCLSGMLSEMSFHEISLDRHDFSRGMQAEKEEQAERDRKRAGAAAIAVPLTVVFPGIVPAFCFLTCGAGCEDPGAKPGDYQGPCIVKLQSSLNAAASLVDANMSRTEVVKALAETPLDKKVSFAGKIEQEIDGYGMLNFSWGCSYPIIGNWLNISTGFRKESLRWAWFRLEATPAYTRRSFEGCKGTWEEVKECAREKREIKPQP